MKLLWVRLVVDDFPAAFRFYRRTMRPAMSPDEALLASGYARFWNCDDGMNLELVAAERMPDLLRGFGRAEPVTLVFDCDDVGVSVERAVAAGLPALGPFYRRPGERAAQLRDPAGTLIEIREPVPLYLGAIGDPEPAVAR
jgi:predicted enzyme related to lactoylglutathione lyase